jgi:uncharacterized protein YcbK (DUF882 family)
MKLTANFSRSEFECTDGSEMPLEVFNNVIEVAENLEVIRAHFNTPVNINSAYRSPVYNRSVGGAVNSQHLSGKAADVVMDGITPSEVADAIEFLIDVGLMKEGGVGRYDTFTHYDIRGTKARWDYTT